LPPTVSVIADFFPTIKHRRSERHIRGARGMGLPQLYLFLFPIIILTEAGMAR